MRPLRVGMVGYGLDRPVTGIGRYIVDLLSALRACHPEIEITLLTPAGRQPTALDSWIRDRTIHSARRLPAMMTLGPFEIALAARALSLDVVHDLTGGSYFLLPRRLAPFARVVTIHDMVPFVYPETHEPLTNVLFRRYIPRTLGLVDRVVTVSDSAKADIQRFYGIDGDKVTAIHNGVAPRFRPPLAEDITATLRMHQIEPPYFLAVGSIQARKNLETLFEAFARLRDAGFAHRLVVVGQKAWKSQGVFQRLYDLGIAECVVLTGYVDDRDLPALYAGADCFVFPSLYEGFGLPPLEAMACGTPVVAARTSSLPEVAGDAAILVEPRDVDGFAAAIRSIVQQPDVARDMKARGLARARSFTWERAAAVHAAIYKEVVTES
jgi:glycosyltransferase involved in cell wall biosynthesis